MAQSDQSVEVVENQPETSPLAREQQLQGLFVSSNERYKFLIRQRKLAESVVMGNAIMMSADYQAVSKRADGKDFKQALAEINLEMAKAYPTLLAQERSWRETAAERLSGEVKTALTDREVVTWCDNRQQGNVQKLSGVALAELSERLSRGETIENIRAEAKARVEAKEKRARLLQTAEAMKADPSAKVVVEEVSLIKTRIARGETLDEIISKFKVNDKGEADREAKRLELRQHVERINEMNVEQRKLAQAEQERDAQQQVGGIDKARKAIAGWFKRS